MKIEKSVIEEIADVRMRRPHVFVLGAGASRAALPLGDRGGKRLPLMSDFFQVAPVAAALERSGIDYVGHNFEELYSQLSIDQDKREVLRALEEVVFEYFSSMQLPEETTLFDHLILSLRPKDVIATFNWDPFLIQAARRNASVGGVPQLLFLHGNVLSGFCEEDKVHGVLGMNCTRCRRAFRPVRLLYPVEHKDYESDAAIKGAWGAVRRAFKSAFMVTFFGYGAPSSDKGAVALLEEAWGGWRQREMEQIEFIDVRSEEDLLQTWQPFVHTHHYEVHSDFYESWVSNHPRRSGEAYWSQYLDAQFIEDNPLPRTKQLDELWDWFRPLVRAEAPNENS